MTILRRVGKYVPALLAFGCVLGGSLLLLPGDDEAANAEVRVDVVVLKRDLPAGSTAADVRDGAEVRELPREAVPDGSLQSLAQIPDGVLAVDHVAGQQLTAASFARNRAAAVGPDFVVASVRLPAQNWTGPVRIVGDVVDVYALSEGAATLISGAAVVLDSPPPDDVKPTEDSIVTLAVRRGTLPAVLIAAQTESLWLVGK